MIRLMTTMTKINALLDNNVATVKITNLLMGSVGREIVPEIDFSLVEKNYWKDRCGGNITGVLLNTVTTKITERMYSHYIGKIVFTTPTNAVIYSIAYGSKYKVEEDLINQPLGDYTIDYCDDMTQNYKRHMSIEIDNYEMAYDQLSSNRTDLIYKNYGLEIKSKEQLTKINSMLVEIDGYKKTESDMMCVINECGNLSTENAGLVEEVVSLEETISKIKSMNLNLQTELTAIRMTNYCLQTPEELEQLEEMLYNKKLEKGTIGKLEKSLNKKIETIKILKNKLDFIRGQKDMIREVLMGGTLVCHREIN